MKISGLVSKLKAAGLATALSVLPAEEVDSGVSYGGSIAVDINKRVSVGGYVSSTDRAKSFSVRGGLNYILTGRDKGDLQLRVGGGYNFNNRIAPSIDLSITPKSESPFSIGAGLGYSSIKKDKKKLDVNGEVEDKPFKCWNGVEEFNVANREDCVCVEGYIPGAITGGGTGFWCSKEY